jgi:hypothetical protein
VALGPGETQPAQVRALGAGHGQWLDELGCLHELPAVPALAEAIHTLPSFWRSGRLIAVPYFAAAAGQSGSFSAQFVSDEGGRLPA